jgi:hypothetical protein
MTIIDAMTKDLQDDGIVTGLTRWAKGDHERTYISVRGYSRRFAGCRSHQLYWDHKAGLLVSKIGKGTTPREYDESVQAVIAAFDDKGED